MEPLAFPLPPRPSSETDSTHSTSGGSIIIVVVAIASGNQRNRPHHSNASTQVPSDFPQHNTIHNGRLVNAAAAAMLRLPSSSS